jgi:hypothetical protein
LRAATNAARVGSAPPFREKVDENNSGFAVANSPTNQNLKGADTVSPFGFELLCNECFDKLSEFDLIGICQLKSLKLC